MLTSRQSQILSLIISSIEKNGICPSFEEMKNQIGVKSKSGIHAILSALEERKYIRKLPNKARAVEVLKFPNGKQYNQTSINQNTLQNQQESITYPNQMSMQSDNTEVPLLGKIAAGTPIEAISEKNVEGVWSFRTEQYYKKLLSNFDISTKFYFLEDNKFKQIFFGKNFKKKELSS